MANRIGCDIIDSDGCVIGRAYALTSHQNDRFKHLAINTVATLEDYPIDMQDEFLFFDIDDLEDFND